MKKEYKEPSMQIELLNIDSVIECSGVDKLGLIDTTGDVGGLVFPDAWKE